MLSFESMTVDLGIYLSYTVHGRSLVIPGMCAAEYWRIVDLASGFRSWWAAEPHPSIAIANTDQRVPFPELTETWHSAASSGSLGHSSSFEGQDGSRRLSRALKADGWLHIGRVHTDVHDERDRGRVPAFR